MMSTSILSALSCLLVVVSSVSSDRVPLGQSNRVVNGPSTGQICPVSRAVLGACRNECRIDGDCSIGSTCCPNSCGGGTCIRIQPLATCSPISCPQQGSLCSNNGAAVTCSCISSCDDEDDVATYGSDGRTYRSKCDMDKVACETGRTIRQISAPTAPSTTTSATTRELPKDELIYRKCHESLKSQTARCTEPLLRRQVRLYYVYDAGTGTCIRKHIRDCSAVVNKYNTLGECTNTCLNICQQPMNGGSGRNHRIRIYYNTESSRCEAFVYKGWGGNTNNFPDVNMCRSMCVYPGPSYMRPPQCEMCTQQMAHIYCDADFVVAGRIKRIQPSSESGYRFVQLEMTRVFKDRDGQLGLRLANLTNPEEAHREFELDVDTECPCPDLRRILHNGALESIMNRPSVRASRRLLDGRHGLEIILSGMVRYDIPTITQNSLAVPATHSNLRRMHSNVRFPNLCAVLLRRGQMRTQT